ncbi:hypothetical protein ACFQZE_22560 [Paenibacillus sp. GCM10027627]|uniref:hypothetical protein n=1 Tax=unclassified Paenibacillus TaxID=185978 RepID=UPI003636A7C0
MKKLGLSLLALVMMLAFASSTVSASTYTQTGTYAHSGGNLYFDYQFYDSHVHGFFTISVYRVTASGDVHVGYFSEEGGRPNHDMHIGTKYLGNQPAGTYKYVATVPSAWMGPYINFHG